MLQNTFIHLPGIGETTERRLWDQGLRSWIELRDAAFEIFSEKKAHTVSQALEESLESLESGELRYFSRKMKSSQTWRLLPLLSDSIAYLDIETTGLGFPPESQSTTIAVLFRGELFVEHEPNRKRALLEKVEAEAKAIVTFNGLSFDLPFLRREFGLQLDHPHIDLRVWYRRLGMTGGLKRIQASLPEIPQRASMDIDGYDAVRLWRMHKQGVPRALETLMTYNAEDSLCLEPMLHLAWRLEREALQHLQLTELEPFARPAITTEVDPFCYALLRGEENWNAPEDW